MNSSSVTALTCSLALLLAGGCTPLGKERPDESTPAAHQLAAEHPYGPGRGFRGAPLPVSLDATEVVGGTTVPDWIKTPALSPGDRLQVNIEDDGGLNGLYEIDIDGKLKLPHLPPLAVAGGTTRQAEKRIADALVEAELFLSHHAHVSVRVQEWSHVQVHVSGAVFNPGLVSVNVRNPEERALKSATSTGDYPSERMLAAALRSAGGVRPDAALESIRLIRGGKTLVLDYTGLIQGHPVPGIPLISGDSIVVPGSGRFQRDLMVLSAITPPGIRVFLSNLTEPAEGNAPSAVGRESTSLPYGSRLLAGAVSANCVGGTHTTNASRFVVLVRTDPLTGREEVVERAIDDLIAEPHRDVVNPFLMPNDSVSCYDSGVTNAREIANTLRDLLLPLTLLLGI